MSTHTSSHSAVIFTGALVQHLENQPTQRLPSTYVGVRRVRPTFPSKKRKRSLDEDDDGDGWVPASVIGDDMDVSSPFQNEVEQSVVPNVGKEKVTKSTPQNECGFANSRNSSSNSNNNSSPIGEIVYKITNADGTQRRMTTKEKKQLKYKLAQAKHSQKKSERQAQHERLIREQKAGRRERQKAKWENKKRRWKKNMQKNGDENRGSNKGIVNCEKKSSIVNNDRETNRAPVEADVACKSTIANNASIQSSTVVEAGERGISLLDEELAALRGERRGIPPVVLTPAATRVARDLGALIQPSHTQYSQERCGKSSTKAAATIAATVMDPILSAQWASQLKRSMVPAETSRAREDMRPMAYRLVPEVWKTLCPASLWTAFSSKGWGGYGNVAVERVVENSVKVEEEGAVAKSNHVDEVSAGVVPKNNQVNKEQAEEESTPAATSIAVPESHSFALLRDPSPSYDEDAYVIFRHLHQHSNLHVACGALFGCDFLLYDGRREDRHSFAGLRVYGVRHCGDSNNENSGQRIATSVPMVKFPTPSAYDMAGFVRTMNTARKIALVGTTMRDDDNGVARVAIVDLALEKVLSAPTHVRKGNMTKRRSAEETASGLARTKF